MERRKIVAVVVVALLILNILLFSLGKISVTLFWVTIAISALIAYKGMDMIPK